MAGCKSNWPEPEGLLQHRLHRLDQRDVRHPMPYELKIVPSRFQSLDTDVHIGRS